MKQAHVALYKKKIVADLIRLIKDYPIVGALNVENLPAPQFQKMRGQLRGKFEIVMSKRRLIKLALEGSKNEKKGIEELEKHLAGMPALIFSREDPFKLNKILQKSKSHAPAKPGQMAPEDIVVKAGPTPFAPGPIIGELGSIGLKTGVEAGKVVIQSDKVIAKKGDAVSEKAAGILARLGITPMEIGLELVAAYDSGTVYTGDILAVDEEGYISKIRNSATEAFNLAIYSGYATKDTVEFLIKKAFNESKAVALKGEIISDLVLQEMISKAEKQAIVLSESAKVEVKEEIRKPKEEPAEMTEVEKIEEKEIEEPLEKIEVKEEIETPEIKKVEEAEEKKLSELEDLEAIEAPKVKVTKEDIEKTERFVRELQERSKAERKIVAKEGPSVEELVKRMKEFGAGVRPPSAEVILEEYKEERPGKKEEGAPNPHELEKREKGEKVPTANELAKKRKKS